jgi:hypothetical protein
MGLPTQVAQRQRVAEAAVIPSAAPYHRKIRLGQRVMAHQLTLFRGWIEQRGDLGLGQLLSGGYRGDPGNDRVARAGEALRAIAEAMQAKGHRISHEGVAGILKSHA